MLLISPTNGLGGNVSFTRNQLDDGFDFRRHPISIDREMLRIMILESLTEETNRKTGYTWYKCNGANCTKSVHARPPLLEDRKRETACFTERHPPCSHCLPALVV